MKSFKIQPTAATNTNENKEHNDYYFDLVSKQQQIQPSEEAELIERIQKGDKKAMDRLICGNLRFVIAVAKQYQNLGISFEDLIQEGNIGLIKAATKFDAQRDNKFTTYAIWWIRETIQAAINNDSRQVRLPRRVLQLATKIRAYQKNYEMENGEAATVEEIAEAMDLETDKVSLILSTDLKDRSLDDYLYDDGEGVVVDRMPQADFEAPDYGLNRFATEQMLSNVMQSVLSERDTYIIRQHYGFDGEAKSIPTLATELGLSRERVRQIVGSALVRLRHSPQSDELRMCC